MSLVVPRFVTVSIKPLTISRLKGLSSESISLDIFRKMSKTSTLHGMNAYHSHYHKGHSTREPGHLPKRRGSHRDRMPSSTRMSSSTCRSLSCNPVLVSYILSAPASTSMFRKPCTCWPSSSSSDRGMYLSGGRKSAETRHAWVSLLC